MGGWPWPLDTVQDWFESLWDHITKIGYAAIDALWTNVYDWFINVINHVTSFFTSLGTAITNWFTDLWKFLGGWFGSIQTAISNWFTDLWNFVAGAVSSVGTVIGNWFTGLWTFLGGWFGSIQTAISNWFTDLWNFVAGAFNSVGTAISNWFTDLWNFLGASFTSLSTGIKTMFDGAFGGIFDIFGGWADVLREAAGLILKPFISPIQETTAIDIASGITGSMGALPLASGAAFFGSSPLTPEEARNRVHKDSWDTVGLANIINVAILASEIVTLGQVDIGTAQIAKRPDYDASLDIAKSYFKSYWDFGLSHLLQQYYFKEYTPLIPPVVDLIRFVVREVITPDRFYDLMPYVGFSREYAEYYWEAHWVLPAFGNLVDAFHRKIISSEELNKFVVWHDYNPSARPGIGKSDVEILRGIQKTLIPRVDLRYGWEMGDLTDEDLVARYEFLGYEDDSELMADIQKMRALTEEVHKMRDEWIRDFLEGHISEDILRANLTEVGIGPARVDLYVAYAKNRRHREHNKRLLDIYEDAYVNDQMDDAALQENAAAIIVDADALALYMTEAYVRKYKKLKD